MGRLIDKDEAIKNLKSGPVGKMVADKYNMDGWLEWCEEVPAIPLDWIRNYISNLKDMGVQLSLRDAQAVSVMVDKWAMDNFKCGPDYCEIGGTHNE